MYTPIHCLLAHSLRVPVIVALLLSSQGPATSLVGEQVRKLLPPDGTTQGHIGISVGLSTDTAVVVGAQTRLGNVPLDLGYVYERNLGGSEAWGLAKKLTAGSAQFVNAAFDYDVAIDGDTIVVGANNDSSTGALGQGSAYVLYRNQGGAGNWGLVKVLEGSNGGYLHRFGSSVAVDGDLMAVSAPHAPAVYLFGRNNGGPDNWGEIKKIAVFPANVLYLEVVLDSGTLAVSINYDFNSQQTVYLYDQNQGGADNWGFVKEIPSSSNATAMVALDGDTLAIGRRGESSSTGAAYVHQRNQGGPNAWGLVRQLTAPDGVPADSFGMAVSLSGDLLLVASPGVDPAGAAYLFLRNRGGDNNWALADKITPSDGQDQDGFGLSLAVNATTVVAGAWQDDDQGYQSGSAYTFKWRLPESRPDFALIVKNSWVTLPVLNNDLVPHAQPLTVTVAVSPSNGVADVVGNSLIYTPTTSFVGTDVFTYTVDTGFEVLSANVSVIVADQVFPLYLPMIRRN